MLCGWMKSSGRLNAADLWQKLLPLYSRQEQQDYEITGVFLVGITCAKLLTQLNYTTNWPTQFLCSTESTVTSWVRPFWVTIQEKIVYITSLATVVQSQWYIQCVIETVQYFSRWVSWWLVSRNCPWICCCGCGRSCTTWGVWGCVAGTREDPLGRPPAALPVEVLDGWQLGPGDTLCWSDHPP